MKKIKAYIHGIYPRSRELIHISRDVLRKRRPEKDYTVQFKKDAGSFLDLQNGCSLDYIEDGKLAWHDIFRPIIEATNGFEIGALTRWFDNNCFFRQPVMTGKLSLDEKKLEKAFFSITPSKKWKVTLPSPLTFAKLTKNESGFKSEKTISEIVSILSQVVADLGRRGVSLVQFNEPFLAYEKAVSSDLNQFENAFTQLKKVKGKLLYSVQFYFGDASNTVKALKKIDAIDIIGIDFYKTALSSLPKDFPYSLAAGVIDGRNSLLEDEKNIRQFITDASKIIPSENLYITNNSDLDLLPEAIARQKIELLTKVRNSFK